MNTELDSSIVNLAKAIGKTESGGNYDAKGKSGESGAYQFMPDTWKKWSKEHLGDENAPMSKENQDRVVYKQIESWGKQGYKPAQIASLWNSGKPDWEGNVGTNKTGVKFDTPGYVKSVGSVFDQLQQGSTHPEVTSNASTVETPDGQPDSEGYINTSSLPDSPEGDGVQKQSQFSKASDEFSKGNYSRAAQDVVGINPDDSLLGKITDNSITRGINSIIPGGKELSEGIGTKLAKLPIFSGQGGAKYVDDSNDSTGQILHGGSKVAATVGALAAIGAGSGLISKALNPLNKPAILESLPSGISPSQFLKLGDTEKLNILGDMLKTADKVGLAGDKLQILKAMKYIDPGKASLIARLLKSGLSGAKNIALYQILGNKLGGFVNRLTN